MDCVMCGSFVSRERWDLGRKTCLACGEAEAKKDRLSWCIAPISNKAGYTRITDYDLLKQINPKRTEA